MKTKLFRTTVFSLLMSAISIGTLSAQTIRVKGTVTNKQGKPIVDCLIIVKNTEQFASSDTDGNYTLNAYKGDTLGFYCSGFEDKEVKVSPKMKNVVLDEYIFEEIIVTCICYPRKKKEEHKKQVVRSTEGILKEMHNRLHNKLLNR